MNIDLRKLYDEIASDEGKVLHCYFCSEGYATVGIGHKILPDDPENKLPVHGAYDTVPNDEGITDERCFELFQTDVQEAVSGCERIYEKWEEFPQELKHILINMCFQLGAGGLSAFRKMNSSAEALDYEGVAVNMVDSRWATQQTPERAERLKTRVLALAG